ncbi:MAG: helix-turn-helix domain-containing protein [Natronomonas sp.]
MTQARLRIDIPDGPWIADVSRAYPEATFRVLSAFPSTEGEIQKGLGLVAIEADDLDSLLAEISAHETIIECSVLQESTNRATIQIQTSTPMILLAAKRSGIPVEMPVEIRDGTARVDVSSPHERLSTLGDELKQLELDFELEYVQDRLQLEQLLTSRQHELLEAALESGYYDTPRTCTLTELADRVGLAKSTCSEILHRTEEIIIKEFADQLPAPPAGTFDKTDT